MPKKAKSLPEGTLLLCPRGYDCVFPGAKPCPPACPVLVINPQLRKNMEEAKLAKDYGIDWQARMSGPLEDWWKE